MEDQVVVSQWQTPATDSFRSRGGDRKGEMGLDQQARIQWQTPRANEAKGSAYQNVDGERVTTLTGQSSQWPTPAARDHKGANGAEHQDNGTGRKHLDQLPNFVAYCFPPHPGHQTETDGEDTSNDTHSPRLRLNINFVELLMGWPVDSTCCQCARIERND